MRAKSWKRLARIFPINDGRLLTRRMVPGGALREEGGRSKVRPGPMRHRHALSCSDLQAHCERPLPLHTFVCAVAPSKDTHSIVLVQADIVHRAEFGAAQGDDIGTNKVSFRDLSLIFSCVWFPAPVGYACALCLRLCTRVVLALARRYLKIVTFFGQVFGKNSIFNAPKVAPHSFH